MHVAVDGSGLARPLAGVGVYTGEILHALARRRPGDRFTVWAPAGAPADELPNLIYRRPPAARLLGRHLLWPERVRRSRPDAFFGPAGLLPLAAMRVPAVVTAHDMAIYRHPEWFPPGQWLSTRVVVPRTVARADRILCVSASTAGDLEDLFSVDRSRLEVVHLGAAARFRPLERDRLEAVRRRLRLPDRYVLFVSTVEPRKNLDTLLDAWAQLRNRPPLVVAGAYGWRHEATAARLARLAGSGVLHLGAVQPGDLPALYNLAACLAHPAWYEGFGLTPLEAMACATPVVASRSSSLPEVVGDAGLLVDPADADAWTAALERVLGDAELRNEMARRGVLRAAEFTWERAASRTWAALSRAARA